MQKLYWGVIIRASILLLLLSVTMAWSQSDPPEPLAVSIALQTPADKTYFDACSLYSPPTFAWTSGETLKSYEIQFSPDEKYDSVSVRIKSSTPEAIIKANAWKKVLLIPGNMGGILYWRVIGTRSDRTTATSDIHSIIIGPPQPVRNADLSEPGQGSLPALSWENNCNIKFRAWFGNDPDFAKLEMKKKSLSFSVKNPTGEGGAFQRDLTSSQWSSIEKLVDNNNSNLHWYVGSWDGLNRYSKTGDDGVIPTSIDRIKAAEAAGTLDHDTVLLYILYVAFDRDSLPAEYRGDDSTLTIEGTPFLAEISQRLDQMPIDLKNKFQPFLLRPSDPQSIWYKRVSKAIATKQGLAGTLASGEPVTWAYVDSDGTPTRIWYCPSLGEGQLSLAAKLAVEIDYSKMWELEKEAMLGHEPCSDAHHAPYNGGDGKLDIYLVAPDVGLNWELREGKISKKEGGAAVPDGRGSWTLNCPMTTFILINNALPFDRMKSTMAHELFHSFQYSWELSSAYDWWMEASATWAKDLVYPQLDFEQEYLKPGRWSDTMQPNGPLDLFENFENEQGVAQYAAYIWPFYLTTRPGGDPQVVGRIWRDSQTKPPIEVMAEMDGWSEKFKEFALWNWNKPPVDKYRDHGVHINALLQQVNDISHNAPITSKGSPYTADINYLHKVSIEYWHMGYHQADVKQLRFDLSEITNVEGAGVQAIVQIGDPGDLEAPSHVEDWSGLTERIFCLEREPVIDIVIVVSNSNIKDSLNGKIKLEALTDPCQCPDISLVTAWTGTITFSYSHSASDGETQIDVEQSANVSFQLEKSGEGPGGIGFLGTVTGTGNINDRLIDLLNPPPNVTTIQGSGSPIPELYGEEVSTTALNINLRTCEYNFDQNTVINAVSSGSEGFVRVGSVRSDNRPIDSAPGKKITLSGGASFPAHSIPWGVQNGGEAYFPGGYGEAMFFLGIEKDEKGGSATVTWSFTSVDPPPK